MYKLTRVPCIESHAYGSSVAIEDEKGNIVGGRGFYHQEDAFDYIKTTLEPDEQYKNFISKPEFYAKDIYDALDDWNKSMIQKYLVSRYRDQCMYEYFMEE